MADRAAPSGLSALLRGVRAGRETWPSRPIGPLVWLHLPSDLPADALPAIITELEGINVLVTHRGITSTSEMVHPLPGPRKASIDSFLDHWKPDLLVWGTSENGLAIVRRAKRQGLKMLLANLGNQNMVATIRARLFTDFLHHFSAAIQSNRAETRRFIKHEYDPERIIQSFAISEVATPLPDDDSLLKRVSLRLGPRPVWCAYRVSRGEIGSLLTAHRHAVKAIPNLILVVVPRAAHEVIAKRIIDDGWKLSRVSQSNLPEKNAEVLLSDGDEAQGTWLRLATVCYMGGTLFGPEAADPFSAVAHGSAVLAGIETSPFSHRFSKLENADAMETVETNGALPAKLVAALAPNASAQLALNAWKVGSEGAEAVQVLTREILKQMDVQR